MFPDFSKAVRKPGSGVNAPLDAQGKTALHLAVATQDEKTLRSLLRIGANPNQQDKDGQSPLFEAIRSGNLAFTGLLAQSGASFTQLDDKKRNAFDWAIEQQRDVTFIEALKIFGADPLLPAPVSARTPLHLAAEKNRVDVIEYLAATGGRLNAQDKDGTSPLQAAILAGSTEAVKTLLALGADPLLRNNQIETPLHLAARKGHADITDLLLEQPEVRRTINEFKTYDDGFTPLMTAVKSGHPDILEKLVAVGGDVNQMDNERRHSLVIAIESGNVETARALIRLGADTLKVSQKKNAPALVHEIGKKNYDEMLLLLYTTGFDLDARDNGGQTALNKACDQHDKEKIRALLALGANPNIPNSYGRRPLDTVMDHYSFAYSDHSEIIGMLLSKGAHADMSHSPTMQSAPLHIAARNGNMKVVEMLLAHNIHIDVPERGNGGMTPFLSACDNGRDDTARLLKRHGADITKKDSYGRGAIHFAARGGSVKLLKSLLAKPALAADLETLDKKGRTPLHHACEKGQDETAALLMAKGARIDTFDNEGFTALHRAVESNYMPDFLTSFEKALGSRADWNLTAKNGDTLLHAAIKNGQLPVAEKLVALGADIMRKDAEGHTPLLVAAINNNEDILGALVKTLKEREIPLDLQRDADGWTALHHAAGHYTPALAIHLLEGGADVNARATDGTTPLLVAARAGQSDLAEFLLSKGADLNAQNDAGETVFDVALGAKDQMMMQVLIAGLQNAPQPNMQPPGPGATGPKPPGFGAP